MTLGTDVLLDDRDEFLLESLQQDVCIARKNVLVISDEEFYLMPFSYVFTTHLKTSGTCSS